MLTEWKLTRYHVYMASTQRERTMREKEQNKKFLFKFYIQLKAVLSLKVIKANMFVHM